MRISAIATEVVASRSSLQIQLFLQLGFDRPIESPCCVVRFVAMGMWDEYCLVCGGPSAVFFDGSDEITPRPLPEDYTWVEAFVGISHTEEVIALGSDTGYGSFNPHEDEKKYIDFDIGCRNEEYNTNVAHGYACHVKCYHLLQRELNYTLRYQDVRPLLTDAEYCAFNKFAWSEYGGLSEYQDQSFGETKLAEDGKLWMIEDPTVNAANAQRVLALWRPLVQSGFRRPQHGGGAGGGGNGDGSQSGGVVAAAAPAGELRCEGAVGAATAAEKPRVDE